MVGFLGRAVGAATPPHQLWSLGERCELPQRGSPAESRPPKGFPLFINIQDDTIILLTEDYHATIGGKTPVAPCVRPGSTCNDSRIAVEWHYATRNRRINKSV